MKYIWKVSEEDKKRILNLHESATKKHFLNENEGDLKNMKPEALGAMIYNYGNSPKTHKKWIEFLTMVKNDKLTKLIDEIAKIDKESGVDETDFIKLGLFFQKDPILLGKLDALFNSPI